jgi:hypothetical protein
VLRLLLMLALAVPGFHARVTPIPPAMHLISWHRGCPVPLRDLRLVRLFYWGFDGKAHDGELVAHRDAADDLVVVFRKLYAAQYPIRRMRRIDFYGASDDRSLVIGNHVSPAAGRPFADRRKRARGMIHDRDAVVRAFASVGWGWGGRWSSPTDYQHFSASGR